MSNGCDRNLVLVAGAGVGDGLLYRSRRSCIGCRKQRPIHIGGSPIQTKAEGYMKGYDRGCHRYDRSSQPKRSPQQKTSNASSSCAARKKPGPAYIASRFQKTECTDANASSTPKFNQPWTTPAFCTAKSWLTSVGNRGELLEACPRRGHTPLPALARLAMSPTSMRSYLDVTTRAEDRWDSAVLSWFFA